MESAQDTLKSKNHFFIEKKLKKPLLASRHFEIIGTKLRNKIPSYITNLTVNLFKKNILQWLLDSLYEINL